MTRGKLNLRFAAFCCAFAALAVFAVFSLAACAGGLSEHELAAVGRYDLVLIEGYVTEDGEELDAESYDYNYILLKSDGKFAIENSYNDIEYSAKGNWSLSGEELTIKLSGIFATKEKHTLADGKIYMNGTIGDTDVTMEFTKSQTEEQL